MSHRLGEQEIALALSSLPGWSCEDHQLGKTFRFATFREAVTFIVALSFEAEAMNHHPEIQNVYNRVGIRLTTHEEGDEVTEKDVKLAQKIEALAGASIRPAAAPTDA